MKISNELIKELSVLSKLELSESENENMKRDLDKIIKYMEILDSVTFNKDTPIINKSLPFNVLREDDVLSSYHRNSIISVSPSENPESFVVPKTVE